MHIWLALRPYSHGIFTNLFPDIFVDNVHIELSLWDTAGQEEFDRLRSLSYDNTDVVVLCFSVDSKDSLENVESKWVGEIQENCPNVKYDMWSHNQAWENSVGEVTCSLPDERGGDKQVNVSPNVVSLNT